MSQSLHEQLLNLRQILICERNCARDLDMQGLQNILCGKQSLISRLEPYTIDALGHETRQLIIQIRLEVRRNTRLYHSCMHTILGIWSAHCRHFSSQGYGPAGNKAPGTQARHLLSGKI